MNIKTVCDLFEENRDISFHNQAYAYMRYMAGHHDAISETMGYEKDGVGFDQRNGDLPRYCDIVIEPGIQGVQNHIQVNSRIMIQNTVFSEPDIMIECENSQVAAVQKAWFKRRWENGGWGTDFFQGGMEVEAAGISFFELGIRDGRAALRHQSVLDTVWDQSTRNPNDWEFVFFRRRISPLAAMRKYNMTQEQVDEVTDKVTVQGDKNGVPRSEITEWVFWTPNYHVLFLGGVSCEHRNIFILNEQNQYIQINALDPEEKVSPGDFLCGPNPFGIIPSATWVESWTPGSMAPASKLATTWRMASWVNVLELYIKETIKRDLPFTVIAGSAFGEEQRKAIASAKSISDIGTILVTEDDVSDLSKVVRKVEGGQLSPAWLAALQYAKEQLNAATGIKDAERGIPLPGERSALEVRTLNASSGGQARHMRIRFAAALKEIASKLKFMGSQYESTREVLYADGIVFNTAQHDLTAVLAVPSAIDISEGSLSSKTVEELTHEAYQQFQLVDMQAINTGVGNPFTIFEGMYNKLGVANGKKFLLTPEELQENAIRQQQQQQPTE